MELAEVNSELNLLIKDYELSPRETEVVLAMVDRAVSIKEIAAKLGVSSSTVNNHLNSIFQKTKTSSKAELMSTLLLRMIHKNKNSNLLVRKPRVLIVDDEAEICSIVSKDLDKRGLKVYTTSNPEEVLDYVSDYNLDFIISDISMPNIDGFELLKRVRRNHRYYPTFIFITGYSKYSNMEAFHNGAVGFLQKPFKSEKLFETLMENYIEDIHEKNRFLRIEKKVSITIDKKLELTTNNIGFGGLFIPIDQTENKQNFEIGQKVNISFSLEKETKKINSIAEIVWRRNHPEKDLLPGLGLKFVEISETDKEEIKNFVRLNKILSFIPIGKAQSSAQNN